MNISTFLKRENNNLDLFRIILACLVIIGHSQILNGTSSFWVDPISILFNFTYSGSIAVKLFFFISGLVVTNSLLKQRSVINFLIARFFRIIPALCFVIIITVSLLGPILTRMNIKEYFIDRNTLRYLLDNLVFRTVFNLPGVFENNIYKVSVNGSLWTLAWEVKCYTSLLCFFMFFRNMTKIYWNVFFVLMLLNTIFHIMFNFKNFAPDYHLLPISFAFGVFCVINDDIIEINWNLLLGSFLLYFLFSDTYFSPLILIFSASITIIFLSSRVRILRLKPKYDISYGIYLWGFLVEQTVFHFTGHIYTGFHCIISMLISIVLAFITHILIEKPFISLGKKIATQVDKKYSF